MNEGVRGPFLNLIAGLMSCIPWSEKQIDTNLTVGKNQKWSRYFYRLQKTTTSSERAVARKQIPELVLSDNML